ncbi:non-ribosomal peptide synthetase [Chryseobacterium sp. LAM-KRS1]|uniref:non-ribosomal peptide synthetase n=1 Tax=Chryseobacterium sp. LAM-KRS1 TaxID=2715754 RepID=UPI0015571ACF|nr:non-ribosomal peptide synthetase [Chryseobacterium sp. LAM-KRS1]
MLQLLEELKIRNIHLSVKNENLVIDTQHDVEEDLINQIKVHKQEIISYILKHNSNRITKHTSTSQDHPVSDAQKRLWLQSITEEGSKAYHIQLQVDIPSGCDVDILRSSVIQLVNDHEIFRTVFSLSEEGEVRQTVLDRDKNTFDVGIVDFKDKNNGEKLIEEKIDHLNSIAFDLSKGPLLRCIIFELNDKSVLSFIFHHIIMDGVSSTVLKQNIFDYYNALSNSEDLHGPTLQYLDYTYWKQSNIDKGNYNNSRDYWLNLLSKNIPVIDLPSSLSRPHTGTFNSYFLKTDISPVLTQKLDAFSKLNQGTLYVGVLSVINILLNKYTSERDITLGTFTSGRNHPDINEMLGLFVNTIVLNSTINPEEDTFSDIFRKTKESFTQAFSHQDYPFDMLVEDLQLKNNTGRNPLFDITVVFQDYKSNTSYDGLVPNDEVEEIGSTKNAFDLNFEFVNNGSFLTLITTFNTDIYEKEMVSSFMSHFKNLLDALVDSPDVVLSGIDYLGAEEKELLLERFNATEVSYPEEETIVSMFEKQVNITPDHIALIYEEVKLTYRELSEQSNRLAHYLREQYDIQSDDLICIQLPRSEKMLISIFGILKSGGAYVPIDVDYPQERTDYILHDTKSKIVIDEKFWTGFESVKNDYSSENTDALIRLSDLAYIIYTSGTTGHPKGVMIEHGSLTNRLKWMQSQYPLTEKDVLIQKTSYSFDVSVWELLWWAMSGGCLSILKPKEEKIPSSIIENIEAHKVSVIHFVPSMFMAFLNYIDENPASKPMLKSLKTVFTSGEALSVHHKEQFYRLFPENTYLVNLYGPTEACIDVTYYDCIKDLKLVNIPIGKPIANTQMYVLDENKQLVGIGVRGELYISGDGLARGYLNRPDLTEEKFVDNPFIEGAKMYRTGDLGRWLPDGNIEYLGRIDDQVKIRGYRIELGEIDGQVLSYSDAIKNAVTDVREHEGEKNLVVYYVSEPAIRKRDLSEYLEKKLPRYMVPAFYVELDNIPVTSNGKIDRRNLPAVSFEDRIKNEYVKPETELEKQLVAIWEEILGVEGIGITDNFFELGGTSINAIRTIGEIQKRISQLIRVEDFLESANISELVLKINSLESKEENVFRTII